LIVIAALAATAICAGLLISAAAARGPHLDPSAPRLHPQSPSGREAIHEHPGVRALLRRRLDAEAATGLILTVAVGFVAAAVIAIGLLLVMAQHNAGLARYDLSLAKWGADHATSSSTSVLKMVSQLGGTFGVIAVVALVAVLELRRSRDWAILPLLTVTVGGQFLITYLIKSAVDRPRPALHRLTGFSGTSFPSGHAAAAAATFAVAALLLGRRRPRKVQTTLAGVAGGIAVAVAGTRVLLGVHWFTDVLAGLAVGWGWFAICSIAFGGRLIDFGAPIAEAEQAAAAPAEPQAQAAASR
jgi:undecaprenyl-diphosphatase